MQALGIEWLSQRRNINDNHQFIIITIVIAFSIIIFILLLSLLFTSLPWIPHFKKKYGGFKIEVRKMSDALEWKIYSIFFVISLILLNQFCANRRDHTSY